MDEDDNDLAQMPRPIKGSLDVKWFDLKSGRPRKQQVSWRKWKTHGFWGILFPECPVKIEQFLHSALSVAKNAGCHAVAACGCWCRRSFQICNDDDDDDDDDDGGDDDDDDGDGDGPHVSQDFQTRSTDLQFINMGTDKKLFSNMFGDANPSSIWIRVFLV